MIYPQHKISTKSKSNQNQILIKIIRRPTKNLVESGIKNEACRDITSRQAIQKKIY